LTQWGKHAVHKIASKLSLADGLDRIMREMRLQHGFKLELEHLALQLLRAPLCFA